MERLLIGQFSPASCSLVPKAFSCGEGEGEDVNDLVEKCDSHAPERDIVLTAHFFDLFGRISGACSRNEKRKS